METRKFNVVLTLSLAMAFVLLMSFGSTDGLKLHRGTEAAMEEMSHMFRSIFPLLPEQAHFLWKTNHLGSSAVHRTTSLKTRLNSDLAEEENRYTSRLFPWWRLQSTYLRKRGPDCIRKCINQGKLHPVQCHSLC